MKTTNLIGMGVLAFACGAACAGPMKEPHFDVLIEVVGGTLATAAIGEDEDPASIVPGVRVFPAELGEFPFGPGQGDEPGFQGFNFPQGVTFTFDIRSALGEWNGSEVVVSDNTMTVAASLADPGLPNVTSGAGFVPGFVFTSAGADGRIHQHVELGLNSALTTDIGVYVLELQVSAPGYGTTPAFWFVLNNGASEEAHDAAVEWVELNLVPTPGAAAAMGLAGAAMLRRRRSGGGRAVSTW
ncbi:MAG: hypothetical protein ACKVZJ_04975 [Phycisphaerales bacterium]